MATYHEKLRNPPKSPWGPLRPAPAPKRGPGLGVKRDRDTYELCHMAWRAGVIESWYYGRRSPSDPTIVWRLDANEMPGDEGTHVADLVRARLADAGIAGLAWGDAWMGYRELHVTYADGSQLVQAWNGHAVVVREVAA